LIGYFITVSGIILCVLGILKIFHVLIYLGAINLTCGATIIYLNSVITLKHYPEKFLSKYILGDFSGGLIITIIYLIMANLKINFSMVFDVFIF
jgi:NADH:ubiquinone oxidoreductase subunit 6 (subunit J)